MNIDPNKIIKLDEAVINRIAAGEVIQRPANALKELIENSLDAKSTNIQITVRNGGLKLLQIQDNGTGIRKEDLEIVCHRFTTSKLKEFEDLHKISTYGFRGEALASISHIAHLTITSKTKNDICAYQANYVDGLLKGPLKPIAGNQGTIINVEDLFYNMHVRRAALRSVSEEYQKIADVVSKYAVHNASVGFSLKKAGENIDIRTPSNSNQTDNVRIIYGSTIARELLEFEVENTKLKFKASGLFTNANFHTKKMLFLLFINHRLVDCSNLKKLVDQVYATYLPKNTHPFVYLSLEIDPINIDVNVHPTKHEVHFLNEDEIIEAIITALEAKLLGCNNSRAFYTQAKLPGVVMETHETLKEKTKSGEKTINPKDLVRTDPAIQKLDKFLFQSTNNKVDDLKNAKIDCSITEEDFNNHHEKFVKKSEEFENLICEKNNMVKKVVNDNEKPSTSTFGEANRKEKDQTQPNEITRINKTLLSKITRVETKLTSILELRKEIEENCHRQLRETFAQHVFVGAIDPQQALIQYSTKLYLCNTTKILSDLFYQSVLYNFQNFAYISFVNAFPLYDLILLALDLPETGWTPEDGDKTELATRAVEILVEKAEMLNEYFSIEIDNQAHIKSLPILLENYVPDLTGLPLYLLRLATEVDWEQEKNCFQTFAVETGKFYAQISEELQNADGKDWKWITEHILYPAVKEFFIPSKKFTENAAILEIANLPNLYKVFERC